MKRYEYEFQYGWDAESMDDIIKSYENLSEMFKEWKISGVKLDTELSDEQTALFFTNDEKVAELYDFDLVDDDESEYGDEDEE